MNIKKNWMQLLLLVLCALILVALILNLLQGGVWIMTGENGKSAYELAVQNGYTGSLSDWLASLNGTNGKDGAQGENGTDGSDGKNGLSAYELAVQNGFRGTLAEWLLSLSFGEDGKDGVDGENGENGKDGSDGKDGISIVNVYISDNGHLMVRLSNGELIDAGAMGGLPAVAQKNDFQLAQENGYTGTLHQWLLDYLKAGRIQDVFRTADGQLTLTLTDGTTVNAGEIGKDGYVSEAADTMGFRPRFEVVVMNHEASGLRLRAEPYLADPAPAEVAQISSGSELVCIGAATIEGDLFYRFWRNGQACYAKAKYFATKYDVEMQPQMNLPQSLLLTAGEPFRLVTEEIIPWADNSYSLVYTYTEMGSSITTDSTGVLLTPYFRDGSADAGHPVEAETLTVTLCRSTEEGLLLIASQPVAVTVHPPKSLSGLTGLIIGDSRVSSGDFVQALLAEQPEIKLLGTRTDEAGNPCEGMGGWKAENVWATKAIGEVQNAFYSDDANCFDFAYYMQTYYPEEKLDFVVIRLGANDQFNRKSLEFIENMINSIHKHKKEIAVLVMTEYIAPAADKPFYADLTRRAQFAYGELMRQAFAGREDANLWLVPSYLSVDTWGDRILRENSLGGYELVDRVHLGNRGYAREAGVLTAYLAAIR